jgi:hypothetical protein
MELLPSDSLTSSSVYHVEPFVQVQVVKVGGFDFRYVVSQYLLIVLPMQVHQSVISVLLMRDDQEQLSLRYERLLEVVVMLEMVLSMRL